MKYLKKFETEADKDAWLTGSEFVTPNVVLTGDVVGYNLEPDPSTFPLYIEAIEDLTVQFSNTYEYSKDNATWTSGASDTTISASAGEKVYFRASRLAPNSTNGIGNFTISGKCNVGGNVMSMAYGTEYKGQIQITSNYQFFNLFNKAALLIDASDLALPATTLASSCYKNMFNGCTSLVTAPALPATTLVSSCYNYMFNGCTKLNYIKAMFTTNPSITYTKNWVSGVSPTGTFVKNSAATWDKTGTSGIPEGWTVETADA